MASKEVKQWNMSDEQRLELRARHRLEWGLQQLLVDLARSRAESLEAQKVWWTSLMLKLRIPDKYKHALIADPEIGKVWVKGEVPALDNRRIGELTDGV